MLCVVLKCSLKAFRVCVAAFPTKSVYMRVYYIRLQNIIKSKSNSSGSLQSKRDLKDITTKCVDLIWPLIKINQLKKWS